MLVALLFAASTLRTVPPAGLEVPRAAPLAEDPVGISRLWAWGMSAFLDLSALAGAQSGTVAMFARDGQVTFATAAGLADIERGRPMRLDTRFRLASVTKAFTATAAMILIEEGRLDLDDPVARTVPSAGRLRVATRHDFDEHGAIPTVPLDRPLTVRHLLTFTSGIGSDDEDSDLGILWKDRNIYDGAGSLALRVDRILTAPLFEQPGEVWRYGWSTDVLARVVEVTAGEPFGRFVERRILEPLGMSRTEFLSPGIDRSSLAAVYTQDERRNLVRVDMSQRDAQDWTPGGSGLVSTAADLLRFALMLWNRGSYDGVRILSPESVERMTTPQVRSGVLAKEGIEGLGWGLGLAVVVDADATPMIDRDGDFWWSGYYGTHFFVSPSTGLAGTILSQNQPSYYSPLPYAVHLAPAFAFLGL